MLMLDAASDSLELSSILSWDLDSLESYQHHSTDTISCQLLSQANNVNNGQDKDRLVYGVTFYCAPIP